MIFALAGKGKEGKFNTFPSERYLMPNKRTDKEKLDALIDALGDSVLEASDEEILEELRISGIDTDTEIPRLKAMMLSICKKLNENEV